MQFRTKKNDCRRCSAVLPPQTLMPQMESKLPTPEALPQELRCTVPYGMIRPLQETIRHAIYEAVEGCEGNITLAARCLKVGKSTLYRYLNKWGNQSEPNS